MVTGTLPLLTGDLVIERPATQLAAICQLLPALWRQACDEVGHTCLPRVILEPNLPAEVTVRLDGRTTTLPNIEIQLLLLTKLQPGRQRRNWSSAAVPCALTVVVEVAFVSYVVAIVV